MRHDSLLRSTPFRLALAFALVFMCASLLSGLVAFYLLKKELDSRYDRRTEELFQIISQTYGDSDLQDVVDATRIHVAATSHQQNIFLLRAPDGRVLAGNLPSLSLPDGLSVTPSSALGIKGDYTYRLFAGNVGPYRLIVGTNNEETAELEEIVAASFGWASLVVLALAIGGGGLIASRAQRRLDAVRETMVRVSHGDLSSRIPLLGRGDDLDLLSNDINDALERLSASVESMRQVSSDIAHDLKTPLNHLKITLEDARLRQEHGAAVREELEVASNEVNQINQIFDALLRIAQIESGARKAHFAKIRLNEILGSLAEVYSDVAEDAGDSIVRDWNPEADATVSGDRELLTQMFANLIENAIRHCPAPADIRLKISADGNRVWTSIEDSGQGIPEDERGKVFRRLYRLEKSRTSAGTGLGLSLVKAIADLHDADIRLEGADPGLRVVVTFALA